LAVFGSSRQGKALLSYSTLAGGVEMIGVKLDGFGRPHGQRRWVGERALVVAGSGRLSGGQPDGDSGVGERAGGELAARRADRFPGVLPIWGGSCVLSIVVSAVYLWLRHLAF
jgi:hypothetical protein